MRKTKKFKRKKKKDETLQDRLLADRQAAFDNNTLRI